MKSDLDWMQRAFTMAQQAEANNEVPIGAVIVINNEIIAEGWNQPIGTHDPTAHAEIVALRQAAAKLNNYRIVNTTLYVTIEPCLMCAGAMVHARVGRLVYGADDIKMGAVKSVFNVLDQAELNHRVRWQGGVMAEECGGLLKKFFQARR